VLDLSHSTADTNLPVFFKRLHVSSDCCLLSHLSTVAYGFSQIHTMHQRCGRIWISTTSFLQCSSGIEHVGATIGLRLTIRPRSQYLEPTCARNTRDSGMRRQCILGYVMRGFGANKAMNAEPPTARFQMEDQPWRPGYRRRYSALRLWI